MSQSLITLRLAGITDSQLAILRTAISQAFPERSARIDRAASVEEARKLPEGAGQEILVLGPGELVEVQTAVDTLDQAALPRWAVVAVGEVASTLGVEVVAREDMEPRLLARALHSSLAQLTLRRQWARERGDVWTFGRRLTHDLRNPLGCIVTTSEMLKEVLADEAPEQTDFVEPIIGATAEMLELINRLHFVAKASVQPAAPEVLDVEATHQAAIDRLQREITRRGARVQAPEVWPEVRAVRPWLEAIWWNLIANALRHGGEPARVETGWNRDGEDWVFWVCDEGPGVPPERENQLFTPFHRLHTRHGGGIGLSIVHRLVEMQGGRCSYERRGTGGARFEFTLPAAQTSDAGGATNSRQSFSSAAPAAPGLNGGSVALSPAPIT
jgi:signal transduction histidine kinase